MPDSRWSFWIIDSAAINRHFDKALAPATCNKRTTIDNANVSARPTANGSDLASEDLDEARPLSCVSPPLPRPAGCSLHSHPGR